MVAPFTGAWIETRITEDGGAGDVVSRPSRARGLKLLVGRSQGYPCRRRALHGRVD